MTKQSAKSRPKLNTLRVTIEYRRAIPPWEGRAGGEIFILDKPCVACGVQAKQAGNMRATGPSLG
jgi:hypothetical protein